MDDNNKTKEQLIAELAQMQKRIAVLEESEIECKRVADALNAAQRYTRGLIEANLDALVTISAKGKITDVNITSEMITGMSRKEIVGTDFSNYFTDPDAARKGYQQVFRDGYVRDYPLEIKHRDGRVTPVLYNASVYKDAQGNVAGVFAAARDITERKKAEEAICESKIKLQVLYDSSSDAIMLLDEKGFFDCNDATLRLFGCSTKEEFCSRHPADFSPPTQPDGTDSMSYAKNNIALALKEGSARFEYLHRCLDGTDFPAQVLLDKMVLGGKEVLQARVFDITESKKVEKELMGNLKDLQQFKEVTVDRENVMIGLKKEVNKLCEELERSGKYNLSFLDE